jgi:NADH dehydrogenase FAD-containing subunit
MTNHTQIANGSTILPGTPANVFSFAAKELQSLGVQIKLQTTINSAVTLPNGQYELILSTGERMVSDMYLPTFGVTPNSTYIPTKYLDKHGSVLVDENLAMNGVSDIWAIGDVSALQSKQLIAAEKQSTHLAKNIILMLNGRKPLPYKPGTIRMFNILLSTTQLT